MRFGVLYGREYGRKGFPFYKLFEEGVLNFISPNIKYNNPTVEFIKERWSYVYLTCNTMISEHLNLDMFLKWTTQISTLKTGWCKVW